MTKSEAIRVLEEHLEHWERLKTERIAPKEEGERTVEAFRMAIETLSEPSGYLISKADAVKTVIRKCSPICDWQVGTKKYPDCVVAEINALPSAEAEWIPCSERLPKKGEVVLITNGKGNVRCGQYRSEHDVRDGTHYWWWKGKTIESVLAWMPRPKPYRKDGEEE